jgi:hypothetical protein
MFGDRYYLNLKCAYCGLESEVYYAPTCGSYDFTCRENENVLIDTENLGPPAAPKKTGCGKLNFIMADFSVRKIEEVVEEDVVAAFEMATTASHSLESIHKEAKGYLKRIKKHAR